MSRWDNNEGYLKAKKRQTGEVDELNRRPEELLFAIVVVWRGR